MTNNPEKTEKTRNNFIEAFWRLAAEKSLTGMTVCGIARKAGYNRSTFYEYFMDIVDLTDSAEAGLIREMDGTVRAIKNAGIIPNASRPMDAYLYITRRIFELYSEKIWILCGSTGDPAFPPKIKAYLSNVIVETIGIAPDTAQLDYAVSFAASASLGLMTYWHERQRDCSPDEFIRLMQTLITRGMFGYLDPLEKKGIP